MEENSEREENLSKKIENLRCKFSIFFDKFSFLSEFSKVFSDKVFSDKVFSAKVFSD